MDILPFLLLALAALAVPFIAPIVALVSAYRLRGRMTALEAAVREQRREIERLTSELRATRNSEAARVAEPTAEPAPQPREERPVATPPRRERPAAMPPAPPPPPGQPEAGRDGPVRPTPPRAPERPPVSPLPVTYVPPPSPPGPPSTAGPSRPAFDWEGLVGVKLFSAIAGIALVIAAVFFLRYSIESGWLQPPVRVAIGVIVGVALLVLCELKAARRYPTTANALDAAAVAILFSTFFAAHALWNLIPAWVTFGLLTIVTALAVLLSIRRDSLFIAVLGLLGGFATPALLSTGENRPIPLFSYLLLLNVGLAWVAYKRVWPVLAWLSLVFTTVYQWGWVIRYLDASSVPLAMGIFMLFPVVSIAALLLSRTPAGDGSGPAETFNRAALMSAVLPVMFGLYLAAVPAYGARPALLFGFVLIVDAGLLAIAIARREELLHATGALATVLTVTLRLATSYPFPDRYETLAFVAVLALFSVFAPAIAVRARRPFGRLGTTTALAGPVLLFAFAVLVRLDAAATSPWPSFLLLFALVVIIAARAVAVRQGSLYVVAAFFAVATQAVWSAAHLTPGRLATAVAIYTIFGLLALGVPMLARRLGRPLEPAWGGGAVLLGSVLLLLFLSGGRVAPEALWALGLLLAILNAALFIETAGALRTSAREPGLPRVSQAGSILSWIVLGVWWSRAAGSVGVISALTVLTGLTLVTLAGHAWSVASVRRLGENPRTLTLSNGLYLGLIGHLFLALLASNRQWAVPPWPLFGALAVITLATSAASLATRTMVLHAVGMVASAVVVAVWAGVAGAPPYGAIALVASALLSAYAMGWIRIASAHDEQTGAAAAASTLMVGELAALVAVAGGGAPPFAGVLAVHAVGIGCVLWLAGRYGWRLLPIAATAPAWWAVMQYASRLSEEPGWIQALTLSAVLYAVFAVYPIALGRRAAGSREPFIAALLASAMFFTGARSAFVAGGLEWMIGVVPVLAGAVLALLLRQLLIIQPPGERDAGRLALVAGGALAFVTVAIPLQLDHQWITIGWALEGAALAWLYRRIPHRGLLFAGVALLAVVFVRLALNPEVFLYEPRGALKIFNWYLYTYAICAVAMFVAARWYAMTDDRLAAVLPRASHLLPAAGVILLFLLLNIEIADFYASGPAVTFRFGTTLSQDLTYTIGWLVFGMGLLAAGIYLAARPARIAAVALIAVTTFKCFLYDLGSLDGLYRVASFVGLAMSLALVSLALQKYVLSKPEGPA